MLQENSSLFLRRLVGVTLATAASLVIFYRLSMSDDNTGKAPQHLNMLTRIDKYVGKETLTLEQREYILSTKDKADWKNGQSPMLLKRIDPFHVTMFSETYTTINVLSPGFCHIRNLYLFNDTFYIVTLESNVTTTIFGHAFRTIDCFPVPYVNVQCIALKEFTRLFSHKPTQWQQTTIFGFQQNYESIFAHYFHFVEELVGIWLVYAAALECGTTSVTVQRVVYPGVSHDTIRGRNFNNNGSANGFLLQGAFGDAEILDDLEWKTQSTSNVIQIESVIIASRYAAVAGDVNVQRSNKMTLGICHVLWNPARIDALKTKIFNSLRLTDTVNTLNRPLILYINRQPTNRRLNHLTHERLLEELQKLQSEGWEVRAQKMEELAFNEQFLLAGRADVIIGVHGNGLTHGLWAPKNGGIIELQAPEKRQFDYEWIAEVNSLRYASVDISGVEWMGRYQEPQGIMIENNITVNVELIGKIIRSWKDGPHKPAWRLGRVFSIL